jgi:pimeloyl-ACP methyl ester carboxylesterase
MGWPSETRVLRYDERGCGLSDRDVEGLSLGARLADLEAVIEAAGLELFGLLGMSQGGPVAIAYAALHPERVSRLSSPTARASARRSADPLADGFLHLATQGAHVGARDRS